MKYKITFYAISIFLIILIQTTILNYIEIFNIKPNLLLVFIICTALLKGNVEGAVVGFCAGLAQDMVAGRVLGFYALLGLYMGLLVGSVNKRLYRDNVFVILFFTFVSTIVYESAVYLIYKWVINFFSANYSSGFNLIFSLKNVILPEAIYNSVVSLIFLSILPRFKKVYDEKSN